MDYKITGIIVEDPTTNHIFACNPVFIYKTTGDGAKAQARKVNHKINTIQTKYSHIRMERFDATTQFSASFAPDVIGGLTRGFVSITPSKIAAKLPVPAEKAPKKPRSKSPPTAERRSTDAIWKKK